MRQQWRLPKENNIYKTCTNYPILVKRTLEKRTLSGSVVYHFDINDLLTEDFKKQKHDELIYQIGVLNDKGHVSDFRIAYANKNMVFKDKYDSKNEIMFDTMASYHHKGSKLWYLLVPFAWIADVITWPIQLLMWINYAGAH